MGDNMKQLKSALIYKGPSELDGKPIIVIAVAKSSNSKTGNMVQTFIMREDIHPVEALQQGEDESVCGDCLARPANGGWCYVRVEQSVAGVWKCFHKMPNARAKSGFFAGYAEATSAEDIQAFGNGRAIRLGTYGDPAAVPLYVWEALCANATGWNGYTHQWLTSPPEYSRYCMASIDQPCDTIAAELLGYRCFVAVLPDESAGVTARKSVGCPAAEENGRKATCGDCMGCGGTDGRGTTNRVIEVHGVDFKTKRYAAWRQSIAA
jgi:hypothetical protein